MICLIFGNLGFKKYMHVLTITCYTKYRIHFEEERDRGRNRISPKGIFLRRKKSISVFGEPGLYLSTFPVYAHLGYTIDFKTGKI